MNRYNQSKHNFYFRIVVLFILGIGIGYAVLSERLTVSNFVNYGSMKWDVGFGEVIDGSAYSFIVPDIYGDVIISSDKKSLSVSCDIGSRTSSTMCVSFVSVKNNSSFDVQLKEYGDNISDDVSMYLQHYQYFWMKEMGLTDIYEGDVLESGESAVLGLFYTFKELTADMLPDKGLSLSFDFEMEWVQSDDGHTLQTYDIGDVITIANENFNVISDNGDTITMLAQYNLGTDYRQNESMNKVRFSNNSGWEYTPGPKEIDIQDYDGNVKTYVNEYVYYLQSETGDVSLSGNLMTLTELKKIGCTINNDYSLTSESTCTNSEHKSWLVNGQRSWLRSAFPGKDGVIWLINEAGGLETEYYLDLDGVNGVRPVVTISKQTLENLDSSVSLISFTIEGTTYQAVEGMTWREWVESEYNTDGYFIQDQEVHRSNTSVVSFLTSSYSLTSVSTDEIIKDGVAYKNLHLGGGGD
jgi:hypothetical protein